jgi:hypothetical protein
MQSLHPQSQDRNTSPSAQASATRHVAPADCSAFTAEQQQALDVAYLAWVNSGYSVAAGEQYTATRRRIQYAAMITSLRGS